ncbi:Uma2 family endonuclease [Salinibacter altiplanensis]|uniref:Uma2 family endonuclease n=1 Tax=Salinibacter altiplanensis TaxID=1803181 RepID=UPI000C9F9696|nr:Uma2 family endonuclease [Salinibacter altiplanensis]
MPTTRTRAEEHQERWQEIVADPTLRDLPYSVETNRRGQIVLSPHKNKHSRQQKQIEKRLDNLPQSGEAFQEWAIATSGGTKQVDAIWASDDRLTEMQETGDPTTLAPEICVEVMSASNDWKEMEHKRALYRAAGAEEVWVVDEEGTVRVFGEEELEQSALAPDFPDTL